MSTFVFHVKFTDDPYDFPKCGKLGRVISDSGDLPLTMKLQRLEILDIFSVLNVCSVFISSLVEKYLCGPAFLSAGVLHAHIFEMQACDL